MKRLTLAALCLTAFAAHAAPAPVWTAARLQRVEPACVRIWRTGEMRDSPLRAPQADIIAAGRIRLQLDSGPGDATGASLRAACEGRVPSLRWEGEAGHLAQVTLAIGELPRLADVPGLFYAMRPPTGIPLVTSEGVAEIGASAYHAIGLDGHGVRLGLLDRGFAGIDALRGTEIPAHLTTRAFVGDPAGGGDLANETAHGTACTEIVHDVAPGADLFLCNAQTPTELQAAVRWLIDQGVAVVSHSVGWFFGPGDGTGPIEDIFRQAQDAGILWVNAAGNQAMAHWGGPFTDTDFDGLNEFSPGDESISFPAGEGGDSFSFTLTWDRWPYSSNLGFDLEIYENGELAASTREQFMLVYAYRDIDYQRITPGSTIDVAIRRTTGTDDARLSLFRADGSDLAEHQVAAGSLLIPADAPRVVSVGAYLVGNGTLERFSSRGPTLDGRAKPELCAPDGVTTASGPRPRFFGTSAACPHAAGAAALLLAAAPEGGFFDFQWTVAELRRFLEAGAAPADFDDPNASRWGRLRLLPLDATRGSAAPLELRVPSIARAPIAFELPGRAAAGAVLRIHDVAGRLVQLQTGVAGEWSWDGCDARGRPCPAGLYLCDLRAGAERTVRRLYLIR
jgi:hypothetical protein